MLNSEKNNLIILVKKGKKFIFTGLIIGLLLFIFYFVFFYIALYTTDAKIYVKNIQSSSLVAQLGQEGSVVSESGNSNPLFNLYELLKAEELAYRIYPVLKEKYPEDLTTLGTYTKETFFETYLKLIDSSTIPSTDIITIKFNWPNREHAPEILNLILKEFKMINLYIKKTGETQKSDFIDKQTQEISKKLEDIRNKIKNYKLNTNSINIDLETANTLNTRMDMEKQAGILQSQIQYNKRKLTEYAYQLNIKDPIQALRAAGIGTDTYLVNLSQQLANSQINYAKLKSKFKDKYIEVVSVKNEIKELKDLIDDRKQEISLNTNIQRAIYDGPSTQVVTNFVMTQAETVSLEAQYGTLEKNINILKEKEGKLPKIQLGLDELKKTELALANAFQNIKEKQLEAKIKESEIIDNIVILKHPTKASSSIGYIITRFLGFIMLGALIGLGITYLKQAVDDRWVDTDELRTVTGQNIIGNLPWLKDPEEISSKKIMDAAYTNIASDIVAKGYLNESFVISFISTYQDQTKSIIAETLAKKVSEMDKQVLFIDLVSKGKDDFDLIKAVNLINKEIRYDLQRRAFVSSIQNELSAEKDYENKPLFDSIQKILKNAVKRQNIFDENKKLITLNKIETNLKSENLNDYIASKGFKYILEILKNHYEFVFINAPHGFVVMPEIQTLKKVSEGIVLICSMDTNKQELLRYIEKISDSNARILGIMAREENSELERHIKKLEQYKNSEPGEVPGVN